MVYNSSKLGTTKKTWDWVRAPNMSVLATKGDWWPSSRFLRILLQNGITWKSFPHLMISLSHTQTHTPHLPSTCYSLDSIPIIVLSSLMTYMFLGLKETSQFHLALPLVKYLQYLPLQAAWAFLNPNFYFFRSCGAACSSVAFCTLPFFLHLLCLFLRYWYFVFLTK